MNLTKKKIIIIFSALACIIVVSGYYLLDGQAVYVPFAEFAKEAGSGAVDTVMLEQDALTFRKKGSNETYYTDNPDYDTFKKELLLAGIKVEDGSSAQDKIMAAFNIIFDFIFFAAAGFGVYKLMSVFLGSFKVIRHTDVAFDDIAGMENLKKDMMYAVDVLKRPEEYRKKGMRAVKGIILEGPPGNGKTLFAKALAQEAGVNFIAAKGADFQSMMMAVGPAKVKSLFKKADRNKPCIIFIDEFDGIGEKRNYTGSGIDKENNRMVIAMLNEMDGFHSGEGVMVIAATNSYHSLDRALTRPGRFDLKYNIGNPDRSTRIQLIKIYTKKMNLAPDVKIEGLADSFQGFSCAAIETIINEAAFIAAGRGQDMIDGGSIQEACEKVRERCD